MKKRRLVIASVLKPIDDTRMYEKMASTLCILEDVEVVVIGYPSQAKPVHTGILFLPLKPFKRISFGRMVAPLKIFHKLYQLKPEALVVNATELLIVALLNRIFFGTKIIYDIRENYFRNIKSSPTIPILIRWPIAALIRLKEKLCAPLFHHFILAEKGYQKEMNFFGSRVTVLENKSVRRVERETSRDRNRLLFTGTIAESTGVFRAIKLAKNLHQLNPEVTLTIVGYCAIKSCRERIQEAVKSSGFIKCIGIDQLVPHQRILEEIDEAGFGIIYYPPSPSTVNSIPTKLYEYMANRLPIITWSNQSFADLVVKNEAGILADSPPPEILDQIKNGHFYTAPISDIYWEEQKFRDLIQEQL